MSKFHLIIHGSLHLLEISVLYVSNKCRKGRNDCDIFIEIQTGEFSMGKGKMMMMMMVMMMTKMMTMIMMIVMIMLMMVLIIL